MDRSNRSKLVYALTAYGFALSLNKLLGRTAEDAAVVELLYDDLILFAVYFNGTSRRNVHLFAKLLGYYKTTKFVYITHYSCRFH